MRLAVLLVLLAGVPAGAAAHPANAYWGQLETTWTWDPLVIGPLSLCMVLYVTGVARIWRHAGSGRGVRPWQVRSFALGWSLLVLALVAPLHWLGERLFAAHMIEHETLMILAAPLLVISRPFGAMMWGLPGRWRGPLGRLLATAPLSAIWRCLSDPGPATTLHAMALWAWHAPPLFNAALQYRPVHWLQHVSFLGTGVVFWWALLRGRERERSYGRAVLYLFITTLHTGFLGILITLSRRQVYPLQSLDAMRWGLSALEDQQLAGLIMWVPTGLIYAAAALALAGVWIVRSSAMARNAYAAPLH
jgi:cytochrome c oxidase assembly factor CtaG